MTTHTASDWQSYLYVSLIFVNSVLIGTVEWEVLLIPLVCLQSFFFVGLLELTHQSVHRNFVNNRFLNEVFGTLAAALIGINLVAYRYFHRTHHRHTCDDKDPEGLLYQHSPATRWSLLTAPLAHLWVAFSINAFSDRYVPKLKKAPLQRTYVIMATISAGAIVCIILDPLLWLYLHGIPLLLFAYIDAFFSQAEHYGAAIEESPHSQHVALITNDIQLPALISYAVLNRNLHRVHHMWPNTRWHEAPKKVHLASIHVPQSSRNVMTLPEFIIVWCKHGPRLWDHPTVDNPQKQTQ